MAPFQAIVVVCAQDGDVESDTETGSERFVQYVTRCSFKNVIVHTVGHFFLVRDFFVQTEHKC